MIDEWDKTIDSKDATIIENNTKIDNLKEKIAKLNLVKDLFEKQSPKIAVLEHQLTEAEKTIKKSNELEKKLESIEQNFALEKSNNIGKDEEIVQVKSRLKTMESEYELKLDQYNNEIRRLESRIESNGTSTTISKFQNIIDQKIRLEDDIAIAIQKNKSYEDKISLLKS